MATDSRGAQPICDDGTYVIAKRWARSITEAFGNLDGLRYNSRFADQPCIALFAPVCAAMPTHPAFSQPRTGAADCRCRNKTRISRRLTVTSAEVLLRAGGHGFVAMTVREPSLIAVFLRISRTR
nr:MULTISPECIES: RES domain-containing protein [Mycolicibacterium]